jgi:preprotein translocase subunit SecG
MLHVLTPLWGVQVPTWVPPLLTVALLLASVFLICLVLIQRGKGGGLAGAFGGAGGQSAFGSRAGDAFTKITIYTALVWILLIMFLIKSTQETGPLEKGGGSAQQPVPGGFPIDD